MIHKVHRRRTSVYHIAACDSCGEMFVDTNVVRRAQIHAKKRQHNVVLTCEYSIRFDGSPKEK